MVRKWLTKLGITAYLATLLFGVIAHGANYHEGAHPSMYFIVWDMFCGWAAYENRTHIVGQGESGKFYELAPGPWGDYHPYGDISRQNYDSFNSYPHILAMNTLKHTQHEPMTRLYVVEECWAKKYNLPEHVWKRRYSEDKLPFSYFRLRTEMTGDGKIIRSATPWLTFQTNLTITDNPRLIAQVNKGQPMFAIQSMRSSDPVPETIDAAQAPSAVPAPLGN